MVDETFNAEKICCTQTSAPTVYEIPVPVPFIYHPSPGSSAFDLSRIIRSSSWGWGPRLHIFLDPKGDDFEAKRERRLTYVPCTAPPGHDAPPGYDPPNYPWPVTCMACKCGAWYRQGRKKRNDYYLALFLSCKKLSVHFHLRFHLGALKLVISTSRMISS